MFSIYVDDIRNTVNKYDAVCRSTDETMKLFRKKYKEGERHFYLDLDHDAGNTSPGGDFINILKQIESYTRMGKMKDLDIDVHLHSGNTVGKENMRVIIRANSCFQEVW